MTDYEKRRITMVDTQIRPSDVTDFPILNALLSVARENFVPAQKREMAYHGDHIDLGQGRVVLDTRVLAKLLSALDITPEDMVLDIGSGLGYSSAVLSFLSEAVIALEDDEGRAQEAQEALSEANADNVATIVGPLNEGAAKHGPYDVMIIQGAVEKFPDELVAQLKEGGRVGAIFVEGSLGVARIGRMRGGKVIWRDAFNATAPLLGGFEREKSFQF